MTRTERLTSDIEKRRYLPRSGTARDVDGMYSRTRRRNIVCDRMMEMTSTIFSPESAGR